ncbi:MAG TPA: hypothetical protein VFO34_04845 [Candidatus Acidoferrales bacterium]|nr:hypothetical protein [Candidatus Acidoferrales bacterium]
MKSRFWLCAIAAGMLAFSGANMSAQGRGHDKDKGNGNGNGNGKKGDDHGSFSDHDRDEMRAWVSANQSHLPPGLAKKDRLPPGLEKQLVVRGTLPPGLQKKIVPVPVELERRLPPPPPDCEHVVIGGHIVLMNRRTSVVLDIFHVEL